jgi:hypothetical protein
MLGSKTTLIQPTQKTKENKNEKGKQYIHCKHTGIDVGGIGFTALGRTGRCYHTLFRRF